MVDPVQPPVEDKGTAAPTKDAAPPTEDKVSEYDEQMLKRFENPKETLKHFKEIQAFASRVSNDKKALEEENVSLKAQLAQFEELQQYGQPTDYSQPYNQPSDTPSSGYYTAEDLEKWATTREINKVAMRERTKDPEHFIQRWGMVQALGRQYPHLTYSDDGVVKLFELADKRLKEMTKEAAARSLDDLLADEEAKQKIREALNAKPGETPPPASTGAYMPETTTSTRTGPPPEQTRDFDAEIEEAIKSGDYTTVSRLTMEKTLAT